MYKHVVKRRAKITKISQFEKQFSRNSTKISQLSNYSQNQFIMSKKGMLTLFGAVVGFFATYLLVGLLEGEAPGRIGTLDLILYLPGAIIGAIVGFASGGKESSSENAGNPIIKDRKPQEKTAMSELLDYKKLHDSGIITQEEFDKKKEELLKQL